MSSGKQAAGSSMDITNALDFGDVVPLHELLSWGPSLWDDDEEEFLPNANDLEEENSVGRHRPIKEKKSAAEKKSVVGAKKRLLVEEADDEDIYAQLLGKNELFDDVEDDR